MHEAASAGVGQCESAPSGRTSIVDAWLDLYGGIMYAAELLSACGRATPSNAGVSTYAIGEAFENCTAQSKAAMTPSI